MQCKPVVLRFVAPRSPRGRGARGDGNRDHHGRAVVLMAPIPGRARARGRGDLQAARPDRAAPVAPRAAGGRAVLAPAATGAAEPDSRLHDD